MAGRDLESLQKQYNKAAVAAKGGMPGRGPGRGPGGPRGMGGKPKNMKNTIKRLMGYVAKYKFLLILVLLCMLCSTGTSLIGGYMLRPIINNDKINPKDVHERQLLQVMCAYRIFMPFAGLTISTRERAGFRDNVIGMCATKISAGVSTGIGSHTEEEDAGDSQFEISDGRTLDEVIAAIKNRGLQPVLNDYVYI